ncbi:MAG: J domain-containing protein [Verrucomicrobiota bacterium]|nr:J domain-containing protein [Verrucomicrobiota bacterium]
MQILGGEFFLLVIDDGPVRKAALSDYEVVQKDYLKLKNQMDGFFQKDLPAFTEWMNLLFCKDLMELRKLEQKLEDTSRFVEEVEIMVLFSEISYNKAFDKVTEAHRKMEENRKKRRERAESESAQNESDKPEDGSKKEGDDEFGSFFSRFENKFTRPGEDDLESGVTIKDLYRALVRKLHPDKNGEPAPEWRTLWDQTQEAYRNGDLHRLKNLLDLCEVQSSPGSSAVSVMRKVTSFLVHSIGDLDKSLKYLKKEPAWRFLSNRNKAKLKEEMSGKITEDTKEFRDRVKELEKTLERWQNPGRTRSHDFAALRQFGPQKTFNSRFYRSMAVGAGK